MIRSFIFFIAIVFGLAIAFPIVNIIFSDINTAVQGMDDMPAVGKTSMNTQATSFSTVWDYTFLVTFLAVIAGLIGLAYFLPTNPVVVFATMIVIVIVGILSGFLANAWAASTGGTDQFSASVASFPIMNFIISYYLHFTVVIGFLILIVFYAKPNQEGAF